MTDQPDPGDPLDALRDYAGDDGTVTPLGSEHVAVFRPGNDTLLVEFGTLADAARAGDGLPWSAGMGRRRGFATLTVLARGNTWFRDDAVHDHFDDLTDEGLFDDYDSVIFTGGGMGAYGAAAHSVAAPGATVFLVQPYATLDPDVTPWETRFRRARARAFAGRYGNAAQLIDAAGRVVVVTDPTESRDAMHASLFTGPHVTRLVAPHAGPDMWGQLNGLGILDRVVPRAATGSLTQGRFAKRWRARRDDVAWLHRFLGKVERLNQPYLTALCAGHILKAHDSPVARRRLNAALADLREAGTPPPPGLAPQAGAKLLLAGE
jgi:hypothetical protein